jgi:hypothetical protein
MSETKELIERLERRSVIAKGNGFPETASDCSKAASLLASQAEEIRQAESIVASQGAKISRLTRERDEALEALKPFAEALDDISGEPDALDDQCIWDTNASNQIKVGDLRRARSVLQSSSDRKSPDD